MQETQFTIEETRDESLRHRESRGQRGCGVHPKFPPKLLRFASDHLSRTTSLDEAEHFLHNHHASVAALRLLFTFAPEHLIGLDALVKQQLAYLPWSKQS